MGHAKAFMRQQIIARNPGQPTQRKHCCRYAENQCSSDLSDNRSSMQNIVHPRWLEDDTHLPVNAPQRSKFPIGRSLHDLDV